MKVLPFVSRLMLAFMVCSSALANDYANNTNITWPKNWIEDLNRFEQYRIKRQKYWPSSHLFFSQGGDTNHSIRLPKIENVNIGCTLNFYHKGKKFLGITPGQVFSNGRKSLFPPGIYAANMQTTGWLGYQSHHPIVWFKVMPMDPAQLTGGSRDNKIELLDLPANEESYYPNQRLVDYQDFHIFIGNSTYKTGRNPSGLKKKNHFSRPSVLLSLEPSGAISRDLFANPNMEKLLIYRIYRDGRLLPDVKASGLTKLMVGQEAGTYLVMLGLSSPKGFFPISNFCEFPLFKETDGTFSVIPHDSNKDKVPDIFQDQDTSEDVSKQKKRNLQLWNRWKWTLTSSLGRSKNLPFLK